MGLATRILAVMTLAVSSASAQVGGFTDNDMYLYSRGISGSGSQDGGILAIDPLSGQTTQIVDFSYAAYGKSAMAFDTYRKRLVFYTSIDDGGPQYGLWLADAAGNLERSVVTTESMHGISPTGDGRIYVITPFDGSAPFKWFDAANRKHELLNAAGDGPFGFSGIYTHNDSAMTYDPGSNALFVAFRGSSGPACSGGSSNGTTIKKIPLSADGTRVAGIVECVEYQADLVQSSEVPSNWSRGPGGMLILICDTAGVGSLEKPRVAMVDPLNFSASTWAAPGAFNGSDQLTAGAYSSARNEVLALDTLNNVMRGYTFGSSGAGNVLAPQGPLSGNPGSGEFATMVEIDNGTCGGGIQPVGVGLKGAGNLVPALMVSGCAQLGRDVSMEISDVVGGTWGMLFTSVNEGLIPFRGGTLYMSTVDVKIDLTVGGSAGTAGAGHLDLPFGALTDPVMSGATLIFQAAFFDPAATLDVSLTQAARLEIL